MSNNNLHPIFNDILTTSIKPIKRQFLSDAKILFEYAYDGYDTRDKVDLQEALSNIITTIKYAPEELIEYLEDRIEIAKEEMIKDDYCPECGSVLDWESKREYDNYVPYGSTIVLEREGGCKVCRSCGWEAEA